MNYAVIDIGSNTIRMGLYELVDSKIKMFFMEKKTLGLISYIEDNIMSQEGIMVLIKGLGGLIKILEKIPVDDIFVFSTAVLRGLKNSNLVIKRVKDDLGLDIDLISQDQEAQLGFLGILGGPNSCSYKSSGISLDIGGGSSEIVLYKNSRPKDLINLPFGSLVLYRNFVHDILPTVSEMDSIRSLVKQEILTRGIRAKYTSLIGIGGSILASNDLIRTLYKKDTTGSFTRNELSRLLSAIESRDKKFLDSILRVSPDRIHTLTPGALVLDEICKYFSVNEIITETHGLKEGYLMDRLGINNQA